MMIFISWKKGPKWWTTAAPFLYLGLIVISDIILPVVNISLLIYYLFDPNIKMRESNFESWAISFAVLCIAKILEFFISLKSSVIDGAVAFYRLRKEIQTNAYTDEMIHKKFFEPEPNEDSHAKLLRLNKMNLLAEI